MPPSAIHLWCSFAQTVGGNRKCSEQSDKSKKLANWKKKLYSKIVKITSRIWIKIKLLSIFFWYRWHHEEQIRMNKLGLNAVSNYVQKKGVEQFLGPTQPHHEYWQPLRLKRRSLRWRTQQQLPSLSAHPPLSLARSFLLFSFSLLFLFPQPTKSPTLHVSRSWTRIMPMAVEEYTRGAPDWFCLFFCPVVGYPIVMDQVRSSASRIFNITSVEGRDDWDEVKINSINVVFYLPLVGPP